MLTTDDIAWKYRVVRVADGARDERAQEEFFGWLFELIRSEREQAWNSGFVVGQSQLSDSSQVFNPYQK